MRYIIYALINSFMKILNRILSVLMYCSLICSPLVGWYPMYVETSDRQLLMNCIIACGAMLFIPILFFIARAFSVTNIVFAMSCQKGMMSI